MDIKTNSFFPDKRALVLGGGGSNGNAWLIGVIAGLFDAGLDVTQADLIIGTSAGATVAAQISSTTKASELYASILSEVHQQRTGPMGAGTGQVPNRSTGPNPLEITNGIIASSKDIVDMRKRIGAWALSAEATSESSTQRWRTTVAARLPIQTWPQREMFITAVNAHTAEPVVFNHNSGVELVDAVAASCSSGFAFGIGDNHYIDGGYISNADNADLAAGYGRVLVLSPFGGRSRTPVEWGTHLATQVEELRANGSKVETIFPDSASLEAFGDNMMDLSRRPLSAKAGYELGKAVGKEIAEFWRVA
jgi:NTE family protein